MPDVGRTYSVDDIEAQRDRVRRLFHLPTEVNELTLSHGGTIPTNARTDNHQPGAGDSWVWTDDGDHWIVEGAKLPANYADYQNWKKAALALIAKIEGQP